ncbi:aminoacyl-tRNA hydrolase [Candidatus Dojkabacteria bacterium]|nr:aminoacyl-tRNA hydrolase [Candidatus Dojkabacteria bacterium]
MRITRLIVGLGNIGDKYANTRHNAGFIFVKRLALKLVKSGFEAAGWENDKYLKSSVNKLTAGNKTYVLAKPATMMNLSGIAVKNLTERYGVASRELTLVYDDLDIELGKHKISERKSPRDHNGVNDVIKALGHSDLTHIRIGIDNRPNNTDGARIPGEKYVLQKFSEDELVTLYTNIDDIISEMNLKRR